MPRAADRLLAPALFLALCALLLLYAGYVLAVPHWDWNAARLASSATLVYDGTLYHGADSGPVLATMYGPVSVLLYLPALWTGDVTSALLVAGALAVLAVLGPLAWLLARGRMGAPQQRVSALAGFVFAAGALVVVPATRYMATSVHADAAALGLGLLSCGVLAGARGKPSSGRLLAAATLAVLSVWAKQIEAPLLLAQAAWLGLAFGRATLLRFVACALVAGLALSSAIVAVFGFEDLAFNLFTIPSRHPWQLRPGVLGATGELLAESLVFLLVFVAAGGLRRRSWRGEVGLLLLVALLLAPLGILARNKVGAWQNSHHALYYLIAASAVALAQALASAQGRRRAGLALAALLAALAAWLPGNQLGPLGRLLHPRDNAQQQAFDFARAHPAEAYFPWNPLSSAFAEGRLYHFEYAVVDRLLAGFPPGARHLRAHLPARMRWVAYPADRQSETMLELLPAFSHRVALPELPGWIIYTREGR